MKQIYTAHRVILLLAGTLLVKAGFSQQDPMYSIYLFDKAVINPAYAGSDNWIVGTLKYRNQFMGFPAQPQTQNLTCHAPLQKMNAGTGVKLSRETMGPVSRLNAAAVFSYHLSFASGKLSFGLEGGIFNQSIAFPDLIRTNPVDNAIPDQKTSRTIFDAAFGTYYQKKNFYLGFSITHLPKGKMNYSGYDRNIQASLSRHYYLLAGKVFNLSKSLSIEPSLLVKYVAAAPAEADINLNFIVKERVTVGFSYRSNDAVAGIIKLNVTESLRVGYSYDKTISRLSGYSGGAHEIFISYGIKLLPPAAEKEIHPRYYF